jgi:hypothetical protein
VSGSCRRCRWGSEGGGTARSTIRQPQVVEDPVSRSVASAWVVPLTRPQAERSSRGRWLRDVIAAPRGSGLAGFPRETRREVPERDVARHLRKVVRLPITVNLPRPRFCPGAARSVVMLEHRAAAQVKTTYVPIEPRVIRIAGVNITGARLSNGLKTANRGRHSTLSLVI